MAMPKSNRTKRKVKQPQQAPQGPGQAQSALRYKKTLRKGMRAK